LSNGRGVTFGWLARSALLVVWALVAWGGLLLLGALGQAVSDGLRPALARLLPAPGTSPWGWLNSLSAGLALAVGIAAAGLLVWRWRSASKSEHPGE
jgi:hypothetical protein